MRLQTEDKSPTICHCVSVSVYCTNAHTLYMYEEDKPYIRRGTGGFRALRPCSSLGAHVLSTTAVAGSLDEWVGGTQREKPLTETQQSEVNT